MPWPADNDDTLFGLIDSEVERQNTTLQLIASENFTSPAVMRATGSVLTNKYSEGYPGKRYYGGNEIVDEIEDIARDRVKELFGADHANVQPHSGANANLGVYLALLEQGDVVFCVENVTQDPLQRTFGNGKQKGFIPQCIPQQFFHRLGLERP